MAKVELSGSARRHGALAPKRPPQESCGGRCRLAWAAPRHGADDLGKPRETGYSRGTARHVARGRPERPRSPSMRLFDFGMIFILGAAIAAAVALAVASQVA
jgi:hypothetical protein